MFVQAMAMSYNMIRQRNSCWIRTSPDLEATSVHCLQEQIDLLSTLDVSWMSIILGSSAEQACSIRSYAHVLLDPINRQPHIQKHLLFTKRWKGYVAATNRTMHFL